jgi:hypothetical protein
LAVYYVPGSAKNRRNAAFSVMPYLVEIHSILTGLFIASSSMIIIVRDYLDNLKVSGLGQDPALWCGVADKLKGSR